MTRDQQSVIWLGLILIALNIIVNLGQFKATIFNKGPAGNPATPSNGPTPGPSTPNTLAPGPLNTPTFGGNGNSPQQTPTSVMVA